MIKSRKQMFIVIGIFVLVLMLGTVTYAFFNYTRTGAENTIATGRIYFSSQEATPLNVTNVFPVKESDVDANSLDSVSITINGDTTYRDGEEFLISIIDVENTYNNKSIPLNFIATYTASSGKVIGSASNDYWNAREDKDSNIYLLNATGAVEEGAQVLVGYIKNGETGIGGVITIKAYVDADRIAISDTYNANGTPTDQNGTTSEWVDERTVLTTTEWNHFQGNNSISFKIKAESNEGIWVETPPSGVLTLSEMCPGCVFIYPGEDNPLYTTWNTINEDPTIITNYSDNYQDVITERNAFFGVILNNNQQAERVFACSIDNGNPFCIEGTENGTTNDYKESILQHPSLWNNSCIHEESGELYCFFHSDNQAYIEVYNNGIVEIFVPNSAGICQVENNGTFAMWTS